MINCGCGKPKIARNRHDGAEHWPRGRWAGVQSPRHRREGEGPHGRELRPEWWFRGGDMAKMSVLEDGIGERR